VADLGFPGEDLGVMSIVRQSLTEDLGSGDITTLSLIAPNRGARGDVMANQDLVVCGMPVVPMIFEAFAERQRSDEEAGSLALADAVADGSRVVRGERVCRVRGTARGLLTIERVLLNFLAKFSGIATLTSRYVEEAKKSGKNVRILDTRKTTPGYRLLEKYAVRAGGGINHRMRLSDSVLIKDNHIAIAGGMFAALKAAKVATKPTMVIEVECDTMTQVEEALRNGVRVILLDNFSPDRVREAVRLINGRARIEVSGGVALATVQEYARAGAQDISAGRLTHSAPAADLSMELTLE